MELTGEVSKALRSTSNSIQINFVRCVLNLALLPRAWSRRKPAGFLTDDSKTTKKGSCDDGMRFCSIHTSPPFFEKKSRCEFGLEQWADAGRWTEHRFTVYAGSMRYHWCGVSRWMAHLLPGSCIIVHFCKFSPLAHNLIHTGYYGTEMQGYWCYRGSLLEWSAVWLIHASWIGASMEDPSLVSFSI